MNGFRQISRKYQRHEFLVIGRENLPEYLMIFIFAPEKTKGEVYAFTGDCLGPGLIIDEEKGTWEYRIRK